MWYKFFIGFIAIVTFIRLVLLFTGRMDLQEKLGKSAQWLVGFILVTIAWYVLGAVFGLNVGTIGSKKGAGQNPNKEIFETDAVKPPSYFDNSEGDLDEEEVGIEINTK